MDNRIQETMVPHLITQFSRARPILFTGAGFPSAALNVDGKPIPSAQTLKRDLWELSFENEPVDDASPLQDVFEAAMSTSRRQLTALLTRQFTVSAASIPAWYGDLFSLAWHRCYTLNIDDLAQATARTRDLPRRIRSVSATNPQPHPKGRGRDQLLICHLNGCLEDVPDHVTFSRTQYAERLSNQDSWYAKFASELVTHPVIFIGTTLDEPPLWQHIELRHRRGHRTPELRPRSYLVTPHLDAARRVQLRQYNLEWIPHTAEDFCREVLSQVSDASARGLQVIFSSPGNAQQPAELPRVSELASCTGTKNEFLLGAEPVWADLQEDRAIEREVDNKIWLRASRLRSTSESQVLLLTGTAGSGKSTSLMRLALRLAANGADVRWLDKSIDFAPHQIRSACMSLNDNDGIVLAIDDADTYGRELSPLVRELAEIPQVSLIVLAIRATKVDPSLKPPVLREVQLAEIVLPPLTNGDIDALLALLDRENRLGILSGRTRNDQRKAFRKEAGRQLLVAMIQATSGMRFSEKAFDEFQGLDAPGQRVYALVAVASSFRFYLLRNDVLLATGDHSNEDLNTLDALSRRFVILPGERPHSVRARHRVIAEIIRDRLVESGQLGDVVCGLAYAAASQVTPDMPRNDRLRRLLRYVINHDWLHHTLGLQGARSVYELIENIAKRDFHFWLQRGSLEVEFGHLDLAQNFLNQADNLAPDDPFVETEMAYLQFKLAIDNPLRSEAPTLVEEAVSRLTDAIHRRGNRDYYPTHVLGSQGLAWSRRGISRAHDRKVFLEMLLGHVEKSEKAHPHAKELETLRNDLQAEILLLAAQGPPPPG